MNLVSSLFVFFFFFNLFPFSSHSVWSLHLLRFVPLQCKTQFHKTSFYPSSSSPSSSSSLQIANNGFGLAQSILHINLQGSREGLADHQGQIRPQSQAQVQIQRLLLRAIDAAPPVSACIQPVSPVQNHRREHRNTPNQISRDPETSLQNEKQPEILQPLCSFFTSLALCFFSAQIKPAYLKGNDCFKS